MGRLGISNGDVVEIRSLKDTDEAETCARMMADSEPFITLQRGYEASLRLVSDPSREVYLALVESEIVGFVVLVMHGAFIGYVQSICVAPEWRNRGIGSAPEWRNRGIGSRLMSFAEKRIFAETPNAFLCVSSFNEGARRFYERLGYEVVGELKNYLISGHSEILMRKTIAPLNEFMNRPRT